MMARVVIAGAADGIGFGIAESYALEGADVLISDIRGDRLAAAAARLSATSGRVVTQIADVSRTDDVDELFARAATEFGGVDIAVDSAGVYPNTPVVEMADDEWDRTIAVNLGGSFRFGRAAGRTLLAQGAGGVVCFISSGVHRSARPGAAHYAASKAGQVMLAQTLALELAPHAVRVNVVSPGFVDHGYREGLGDFVTPQYREAISRGIPLGRVGEVADIVNAVRFACAPESQWMTGSVITVDGGSGAGRMSLPSNTESTGA